MLAANLETRQLLTAKEVAAMLRVEPMTVYNLTTARKLPSFKLGGARRYRVEDVEAYMAASYIPAKSEVITTQ